MVIHNPPPSQPHQNGTAGGPPPQYPHQYGTPGGPAPSYSPYGTPGVPSYGHGPHPSYGPPPPQSHHGVPSYPPLPPSQRHGDFSSFQTSTPVHQQQQGVGRSFANSFYATSSYPYQNTSNFSTQSSPYQYSSSHPPSGSSSTSYVPPDSAPSSSTSCTQHSFGRRQPYSYHPDFVERLKKVATLWTQFIENPSSYNYFLNQQKVNPGDDDVMRKASDLIKENAAIKKLQNEYDARCRQADEEATDLIKSIHERYERDLKVITDRTAARNRGDEIIRKFIAGMSRFKENCASLATPMDTESKRPVRTHMGSKSSDDVSECKQEDADDIDFTADHSILIISQVMGIKNLHQVKHLSAITVKEWNTFFDTCNKHDFHKNPSAISNVTTYLLTHKKRAYRAQPKLPTGSKDMGRIIEILKKWFGLRD